MLENTRAINPILHDLHLQTKIDTATTVKSAANDAHDNCLDAHGFNSFSLLDVCSDTPGPLLVNLQNSHLCCWFRDSM